MAEEKQKLSKRQTEVVELLSWGLKQNQIAEVLKITPQAVNNIIRRLKRKYKYCPDTSLTDFRPKTVSYNPSMDGQIRQRF